MSEKIIIEALKRAFRGEKAVVKKDGDRIVEIIYKNSYFKLCSWGDEIVAIPPLLSFEEMAKIIQKTMEILNL